MVIIKHTNTKTINNLTSKFSDKIDDNTPIQMVMLDLSAAFDTLDLTITKVGSLI